MVFSNGKHMVNVGKHTIHGCYGVYIYMYISDIFLRGRLTVNLS